MSLFTKIFFSKEHEGRQSKKDEVDVYRRQSDSSKTEKIDHCYTSKGYGEKSAKIDINHNK